MYRLRPTIIIVTTIILVMNVALCSCGVSSSSALYRPAPPNAWTDQPNGEPVDPDRFVVDSSNYPTFQTSTDIQPPTALNCWQSFSVCENLAQIQILKTDVWRVTHVVAGHWLIESTSYQNREEDSLQDAAKQAAKNGFQRTFGMPSNHQYNFAICVDQDGRVDGGWELLPGSAKLFSERYMYFSFDQQQNAGWPTGSVFTQMSKIPAH